LAFDYCFHPLTSQLFSGEHLGLLLAETGRLEKKRRVFFGADFEDVMDQRQDQRVAKLKLDIS
jgi:hypothetical protein